ncbi:MAG: hypothetical protein ABSH38_08920 [Verrucomicrobiota bacterium]|jgi:hypothetical protein
MKTIGEILKEKNLQLDTENPVLRGGFTQVPNFILKDSKLSVGAKVAYAMFLSYAWHNESCFPGQERLATDMGMTRPRVTQLPQQRGLHTWYVGARIAPATDGWLNRAIRLPQRVVG